VAFANEIGISPGIVVGRLQHDNFVDKSHFTDLKVRYEWAKKKAKPKA
jgi:HTH-type transcriptional regulator/antitoxin HigA